MGELVKTNLSLEPWIKAPETVAVMAALGAGAPAEPVARFVGGCVRNGLLGEQSPVEATDIDIATSLAPERVVELLEAAGLKAVPTGIEHGTITAISGHKPFEITTLRKDVATDGRRATIAYTDDWAQDAKRRDFTMNAIFADETGEIFDPLGGLEDLQARRVRFIGDASTRILEDYLRILRFFRIHAVYGQGALDQVGLQACAAAKDHLSKLSAERVQSELIKLLSASDPLPVMRQMAAVGVMSEILPEATNYDLFGCLVAADQGQFFEADPVLRLGALLETDGDATEALSARLRLSGRDAKRLKAMRSDETSIVSYMSIRELRRTAYLIGQQCLHDRIRLAWAGDPKATNGVQWRALLAMGDTWQRPQLPLTGSQVQLAGVPEGPEVGRVLREVEAWWIETDFTEDRFSIAERLKAIVQASIF